MISSATYAALAGDTVLVHGGTYYETVKSYNSGEADPGGAIRYIYFLAAGDGPSIIKAQESFCFLVDTSDDYIWIEGFYLTQSYPTSTAHGAAVRTFGSHGVIINNRIYDNDVGVFCEGNGGYAEFNNNRSNYIAHNVISNSREAGVRLKHSSENDVVFNLFYDNGREETCGAVTYYCGTGNRVINNTFWNNRGPAVSVYNGTASDSCMASAFSDVRDNIFARPDPGLLLQVQEKTAQDSTSTYSYNLFWAPDSGAGLVDWGSNEWGQGGSSWNLNQYKYYAGQINPLNSVGVVFADPEFVNPGTYQLELQPFSPAVDAGSRPADQAPYRNPVLTPLLNPPDAMYASQLTAVANQMLDIVVVDLGYHHSPNQYSINPLLVNQLEMNIFPNPYNGNGELAFVLPNVAYARSIHGAIFNLQGRIVQRFTMPDAPLNVFKLHWDTRFLSSGNYFFVMNVDGHVLRQKIMLVK
jgi:hypothetical protein